MCTDLVCRDIHAQVEFDGGEAAAIGSDVGPFGGYQDPLD
jgi:hypothetical protein